VANEVEKQFSGGRQCDIVILGNRRNLWLLLSECKHLRNNSYAGSCPLLWLSLCQTQPAVYLTQLCYVLCSSHLPLFYFLNVPDEAHPLIQGGVFPPCSIRLKKQENWWAIPEGVL
jgi:hypothetical protein